MFSSLKAVVHVFFLFNYENKYVIDFLFRSGTIIKSIQEYTTIMTRVLIKIKRFLKGCISTVYKMHDKVYYR